MMMDVVSGSCEEHFQHIIVLGALDRVAADAHSEDLTQTQIGGLFHRLIRQRAGAGDNADRAALVDVARHDADFAGIRRDNAGAVRADQARFASIRARCTFIMSSTGMPSVMQTISSISASMASRMESAAKGAARRSRMRWLL